ncbi:Dabb family protein [Stappia sp.]|uniref:Dabb family protein n=1 Tax=Stappia sp. TaxID=1870903 RepID=UPI003A9902E2
MIRHIVFFTARRPEDREAVFQGLSLLNGIPHCAFFEIGRNFDTDPISPRGPDFIVYGEFRDEEQLAAYKAHPLYRQSIDVVRPLRDMRIAADFLSEAETPAD